MQQGLALFAYSNMVSAAIGYNLASVMTVWTEYLPP